MPTLDVSKKTTLAELQQFATQAGGQDKIRAKAHDDGSFTLYSSSKAGGSVKHSDDKRAQRQANARDAVSLVLTAVKGRHVDQAMQNVLAGMPQGEMRGADLARLLGQTAQARQGANPAALGYADIATLLKDALASKNADALADATHVLAERLGEELRGMSREAQLDVVVSRGDTTKALLLQDLAEALDEPGPLRASYAEARPSLRKVLDQAFDRAVQNLSDRQIDATTLVIGGTTYAKERDLATGGYGKAEIFKAVGSDDRIVVKSPLPAASAEARQEKFDQGAAEIRAHRNARAGDPPNVIGLKGAMRTPDGGLRIALELAPRGDLEGLQDKLRNAVDPAAVGGAAPAPGKVTRQQATLAMLTAMKDMAAGLAHIQVTRGMTHLDVKAANAFIDGAGHVKIGDFGLAQAGTARKLDKNPIGNPTWVAPEIIKVGLTRNEILDARSTSAWNARQAALNDLRKAGYSAADIQAADDKYALKDRIYLSDFGKHLSLGVVIDSKADTWSFGVDLYRNLTGSFPFDEGSPLKTEKAIAAFAQGNGRIQLPPNLDLGLGPQAMADLNQLLGSLLHPDPQARPTMDQVLRHPAFQIPGVGSQAARDTVRQVTTDVTRPPGS